MKFEDDLFVLSKVIRDWRIAQLLFSENNFLEVIGIRESKRIIKYLKNVAFFQTVAIFCPNTNYIFLNWGCMIYTSFLSSRKSVSKDSHLLFQEVDSPNEMLLNKHSEVIFQCLH